MGTSCLNQDTFTEEVLFSSHMTKNSKYPCSKIRIFIDVKLSLYILDNPHKKYWQFQVHSCCNLGTGTFLVLWLARQISNVGTIVGFFINLTCALISF